MGPSAGSVTSATTPAVLGCSAASHSALVLTIVMGTLARRLDEALNESERREAQAHPAAVAALEQAAPGIVGARAVGLAVHQQAACADGQHRGVEERHLDPLAEAVALSGDERHDDGHGRGERPEAR